MLITFITEATGSEELPGLKMRPPYFEKRED